MVGLGMNRRKKTMEHESNRKERIFSVDLKRRSAIRTVSLGDGGREEILIEGTLGTLESLSFGEGVVLQLAGTEGILRVDLTREEALATRGSARPGEGGEQK
jgi:hypothetical protein